MQKLICKNCEHSELLTEINGSNTTKILIVPEYEIRKKDGLHI